MSWLGNIFELKCSNQRRGTNSESYKSEIDASIRMLYHGAIRPSAFHSVFLNMQTISKSYTLQTKPLHPFATFALTLNIWELFLKSTKMRNHLCKEGLNWRNKRYRIDKQIKNRCSTIFCPVLLLSAYIFNLFPPTSLGQPIVTTKDDKQEWQSKVTTKDDNQEWQPRITIKGDNQRWKQRVTNKDDCQM